MDGSSSVSVGAGMSRFDNGVIQLYEGDARQVLRELPAESVHCVVTSPPYWGLRDYGLEPLVWGGADHEHEWGESVRTPWANEVPGPNGISKNTAAGHWKRKETGPFCPCGAWRGSLGLEPTIDLYVQHIVEIFREVRRVLRKDGTLWLNMGDSYAGSQQGIGADGTAYAGPKQATNTGSVGIQAKPRKAHEIGLKPKDLCMMPARVALALQADGWWLRSDIVWPKPNAMPESVTDRPTRVHEYVFLLTKAERYYYDADAIRESHTSESVARFERGGSFVDGRSDGAPYAMQHSPLGHNLGRNKRSVWEIATEPMGYEWCKGCGMVYTTTEYRRLSAGATRRCTTALDDSDDEKCGGTRWEALETGRLICVACEVEYAKSAVDKMPKAARCRRCEQDDAWGSHFATFPQKLVEPCILAGCPSDGTVLDPFAGSGTVAYVAQRLGRRAIGIDLSGEYLALAEKRMRGQTLPMELGG